MKRIAILLCLSSLVGSLPAWTFQSEESWQWPINTQFGLTASFGEYRGLRFHMGLDFSTGGVEGEPIRPARAGSVEKVRAQANGYGRVIYMRHAGGYQTVYAHLAQFGPKLEAAIRAAGSNPSGYFGTLDLDVPLTADDLLAYSGESGAGLPHLHFEVRAPGNQPIDPLTLGFPTLTKNLGQAKIDGLIVTPLDEAARVNDAPLPFRLNAGTGSIRASGKVGLQILASIHGPRNSKLGIRGIRVRAGGRVLGSWIPRKISFDDYRLAGLVFDQAASGFGPTRYAYCFDGRAEYLPWVDDYAATAPLEVREPVNIEIEVMGLQGTWQKARYSLSPNAAIKQAEVAMPHLQSTSLATQLFGSTIVASAAGTSGSLVLPERMLGLEANAGHLINVQEGDPFDIIWRTSNGSLKRTTALLPNKRPFQLSLGKWTVRTSDFAKIPPTAILLAPPNQRHQSNQLLYESQVLRFGRPGLPAKGLRASFTLEGMTKPNQLGIYAWSPVKKKWRFLGRSKGSGLAVDLDYLTELVVARDIHAPRVLRPKFHDYFTGRRVVIPLGDRGSGIDAASVRVMKGNKNIAGEYDRDRGWIILPLGASAPWRVTVKDRASNTTSVDNLRP